MEHIFTSRYLLAGDAEDPNALVELLGEAGCTDVLLGTGRTGRLALTFARNAESAGVAVHGAMTDVLKVAPGAKLIEVVPVMPDAVV
jgi:hypothetical protein